MDQIVQQFLHEASTESPTQHIKTNIFENQTNVELQLLSPGLSKDNFTIEVSPEKLMVKATTIESKDEKPIWKKSFALTNLSVDLDQVKANYDGGILYISLKKTERESQTRKISVE